MPESDSKNSVELKFKVPEVPKGKEAKKPADEEVQKGILPEGFYDDARKDAEARHVPFRDKMDEEMEAFQKELGALNQVWMSLWSLFNYFDFNIGVRTNSWKG